MRGTGLVRPIVLVVEDEPMQMLSACDLVEEIGFEALVASNADAAVTILEERTDIRIVFTDIDMPGSLDGMKLAACIRKRWPPIEILITSGQKAPELSNLPVRAIFIPKPYRSTDIQRVLMDMAVS